MAIVLPCTLPSRSIVGLANSELWSFWQYFWQYSTKFHVLLYIILSYFRSVTTYRKLTKKLVSSIKIMITYRWLYVRGVQFLANLVTSIVRIAKIEIVKYLTSLFPTSKTVDNRYYNLEALKFNDWLFYLQPQYFTSAEITRYTV